MYAVFGATIENAKKDAAKKVSAYKDGKALTLEEYSRALDKAAQEIFAKGKAKQLSCIYMNKKQAQQYLKLAKGAGAKPCFIKAKVIDKRGGLSKITGKIKLCWELV